MNKESLTIDLIIISVLLILVVLLQNKGAGLSEIFGGSDAYNYQTKRGIEKILSKATVLLFILLVIGSIAKLII